ncbi:hypothetical protein ACWGI9_13310 [Streptomyces sp. NPDC054833]
MLRDLVEHIAGPLADNGDNGDNGDNERVRAASEAPLRRGNGASVQRKALEWTGSLRDVVTECVWRTLPGGS